MFQHDIYYKTKPVRGFTHMEPPVGTFLFVHATHKLALLDKYFDVTFYALWTVLVGAFENVLGGFT